MKVKKIIRKIHRWIGVLASLWLLLLASTGLLLQHSAQWGLDKTYINHPFILKKYGIGAQFIAFKQDGHLLSQIDNQLIEDSITTVKLSEKINSAIYNQPNWIVSTDSQILWIDLSGQIIQVMDELDDLPLPINNIGKNDEDVFILSDKQIYHAGTLKKETVATNSIKWSQAITDPELKEKAIQLTSLNYLSYEQVIFDLHAGITTPSLINDIAAITLIILALSGIYLFFRKKNRTNPSRQ